MSGGSFNYLCFKHEAEDILGSECMESLEGMVARLKSIKGTREAWEATEDLIVKIERVLDAVKTIQEEKAELDPVFKAVEWLDSGDWGMEEVERALKEFSQGKNDHKPK